jgi:hypothetical protein
MALATTAEHQELVEVLKRITTTLERIATALEQARPPGQVTYSVPAPEPAAPHIPNPYWNPPTYQPLRFDYHTGDPLPPQRPENIC